MTKLIIAIDPAAADADSAAYAILRDGVVLISEHPPCEMISRKIFTLPPTEYTRTDGEAFDIFKVAGNACFGPYKGPFDGAPLLSIEDQIAGLETKLDGLVRKAETAAEWAEIARIESRELVPLLRQKAVPADPMRKTAESIDLATRFSKTQVQWIMDHDWFVRATADGAVVVLDRFTYNGSSYSEHVIWGGTFAELRDWAGY